MRKCKVTVGFPVLLFLLAGVSYGQSLGDVAREQRQKQQAKDKDTPAAHKVVTNEDIPESPEASNDAAGDDNSGESSARAASAAGKKSADQWKAEIKARKARIAALQSGWTGSVTPSISSKRIAITTASSTTSIS